MRTKVKNIIFLHICIFIYTWTTITAKITSRFDFLSWEYILGYVVMVFILGVYAILWQQAIKPDVYKRQSGSNRGLRLLQFQ